MSRRYPQNEMLQVLPELNSEKFILENHEEDNSLNFLFYYKDTIENLEKLGYEIVGFCDEPNYCRYETWGGQKEIMPGIMICDMKTGREFWSHIPGLGIEIFFFENEDSKSSLYSTPKNWFEHDPWREREEFEKLLKERN